MGVMGIMGVMACRQLIPERGGCQTFPGLRNRADKVKWPPEVHDAVVEVGKRSTVYTATRRG
jgi:hypothetical protein